MNLVRLPACATLAALALFVCAVAGARTEGTQSETSFAAQSAPSFSREELDQLIAPIALYSDALLAQVLMASTYPLEIVEADRWTAQNPSRKGAPLLSALDKEKWDASVKALVQVPAVLRMMTDKLAWTQKLGDAFLAQQKDVMAAAQRLRQKADKAGNLKSTKQQTVVYEHETIVIQQASPEIIYVPAYNPRVVYGKWPYPAYPPYYWGPGYWPYAPVGAALGWGVGMGITASIWNNGCDWNTGSININANADIGANRWRNGKGNWRHDPGHRRGVNYRDSRTRDQFAKGDRNAAGRADFRGRDGRGRGRATPTLSNRDLNRVLSDNRAGAHDRGTQQAMAADARAGNRATSPLASQNNQLDGRGGTYAPQRGSRGYGSGGGFDGVGRAGQTRNYSNRGGSSRARGGRGGGRRR